MTSDRSLAVAKHGPVVSLIVGLVIALGYAALSNVVAVPSFEDPGVFVAVLAVVLVPVSCALLYQAAFVARNPKTAVEHDVEPPSKYDTSYDTIRGAKRTAVLTAVAGVFGLAIVGAMLLRV